MLARTSDATAALTWPQSTTHSCWRWSADWTTLRPRVAEGTAQARREGNAMALDLWATIDGVVHLTAGRLSAARAAAESLPPPARTGADELDMIRMVILAEVAARTDDRNVVAADG